jgi:hypothetical protein
MLIIAAGAGVVVVSAALGIGIHNIISRNYYNTARPTYFQNFSELSFPARITNNYIANNILAQFSENCEITTITVMNKLNELLKHPNISKAPCSFFYDSKPMTTIIEIKEAEEKKSNRDIEMPVLSDQDEHKSSLSRPLLG